jgi:hypothetical protein
MLIKAGNRISWSRLDPTIPSLTYRGSIMNNPLSSSIHRLLIAAGLFLATAASASGQGTQDTSNSRQNRESSNQALGPRFGQPDAPSTEDPGLRRGQVFEAPGPGTWRDLDRRLARIEDELEEIRRILETLARVPGRGFDNDVDDDEEFRLQPGRQTRRTDDERFRLAPGTDGSRSRRPAADDNRDRSDDSPSGNRTPRPRPGNGGAPRLAPGAFGTGGGTGTDSAAGGGTGSESPSRSP